MSIPETNMPTRLKFVNIPADIELAALSFLMAIAINWPGYNEVLEYLADLFGVDTRILALAWGLVLTLTAFTTIIFKPRGQYYPVATVPIVIYFSLAVMVRIQAQLSLPTTLVVVPAFIYLLFKNFVLQTRVQELEASTIELANQVIHRESGS